MNELGVMNSSTNPKNNKSSQTLHQLQPQRIIRVFISSTFYDMQAERNYLAKYIFPQLRKLCETRNVTWGHVDLRWGITEKQAIESRILPICLKEVHHCRPYFIGLLGERYGTVLDTIDQVIIENEPWIKNYLGSSITELEILHGVFNNPDLAEYAFFYFRDPTYINSLQPAQKENFIEVPNNEEINKYGFREASNRANERKSKLSVLKNRIRGSGFPVKEGFRDPHQLGEWILNDFTRIIDNLFPENSEPNPLRQVTRDHEEFAASRSNNYIGDYHLFSKLDTFIKKSNKPIVVTGEPGSGKSSLLAKWSQIHKINNPNDLILMHFIGISASSIELIPMLRRLIFELKAHFNISGKIPNDTKQIILSFTQYLLNIDAKNQIFIIIDALDQLNSQYGAQELYWLPFELPKNIHIIVSALQSRPLEVITERECLSLEVNPMEISEREFFISSYLTWYSKQLNETQTRNIIYSSQSNTPLGLKILLDELIKSGNYKNLDRIISRYLKANSTSEMIEMVISRCETDFELYRPNLVGDSLSLIWASRNGLSEDEILSMLGNKGDPLPHYIWTPFFLSIEPFLVNRNGLFTFSHNIIRQKVEGLFLFNENLKVSAHTKLANYFCSEKSISHRFAEELPWQLLKSKSWNQLFELLTDFEFLSNIEVDHEYDFQFFWERLIENSNLKIENAYCNVINHPEEFNREIINMIGDTLSHLKKFREAELLFNKCADYALQRNEYNEALSWFSSLFCVSIFTNNLSQASTIITKIEKLSKENNIKEGLIYTKHAQATLLFQLNNYKESEAKFNEMISLNSLLGKTKINNFELLAEGELALIQMRKGDYDEGLKILSSLEKNLRIENDLKDLTYCLYSKAIAFIKLGDAQKALEILKEDEYLCKKTGNFDILLENLKEQEQLYFKQGKIDFSKQLLAEALQIVTNWGGKLSTILEILRDGANISILENDFDKASKYYKVAENMSLKYEDYRNQAISIRDQAYVLYQQGKNFESLRLYKKAEEIFSDIKDIKLSSEMIGTQATLFSEIGDFENSKSLYKIQENKLREIGDTYELIKSLTNQGVIYYKTGDELKALELLRESWGLACENEYYDLIEKIDQIIQTMEHNWGFDFKM